MKKSPSKLLILFIIAVAFLVFLPLSLTRARAIDTNSTYQTKSGVMVQINDGNPESSSKNVKIDVDVSGNPKATMFAVVICQNSTGYCSKLIADHRYNSFTDGKATVYASLNWIKDNNSEAVIDEGIYDVKVKPEYKDFLIKDIIVDDNYDNRYIHNTFRYNPIDESDVHIKYNGLDLVADAPTNIASPVFSFEVGEGNGIYGLTSAYVDYSYCMTSTSWTLSGICTSGSAPLENFKKELDLTRANLEGHYILKATFSIGGFIVDKEIKFFYDKTAPRIIISDENENIARSHTITVNVVDNSNVNVRYAVLPDYVQEVKNINVFTNNVSTTHITVDSLTGNYKVWAYAVDSNNNYTIRASKLLHFDNTAPAITKTEYFYDEINKEIIVHVKEIIDQCEDDITFYASTDKENYISSSSNYFRVSVANNEDKIYIYATDKLGNEGKEHLYELPLEYTVRDLAINYVDGSRDNYYNGNVTFTAPLNAKSIIVNGNEYIFNSLVCDKKRDNYECKFTFDGTYTVAVSDGIITTTSSFIIDKDGTFNIDGTDTSVASIVVVPIMYSGGKYYGRLPAEVYDVTKDVTLIYKTSDGNYAKLSANTNNIGMDKIGDYYRFELNIAVATYQNASYSAELSTAYCWAIVTPSDRSNIDLVVVAPEFPTGPDQETPMNDKGHKYGTAFDWRSLITLKNIIIAAVIIVVAFYLIRFFVFRKND